MRTLDTHNYDSFAHTGSNRHFIPEVSSCRKAALAKKCVRGRGWDFMDEANTNKVEM